jgi:hypothetical protein
LTPVGGLGYWLLRGPNKQDEGASLSKINLIQRLVQNGLYYLTEHAVDEALADGFDVYDVENALLTGRTRRTWPKEGKMEVVGRALDGRPLGAVCRLTQGMKVRVITVYEDNP